MSISDSYLVISEKNEWSTGNFGIDFYKYEPEYHDLITKFIDTVKETVGHEYIVIELKTEQYTADTVAALKRLDGFGMTINFNILDDKDYIELDKITKCDKCSDLSLLTDDRFDNIYRMKCIHS